MFTRCCGAICCPRKKDFIIICAFSSVYPGANVNALKIHATPLHVAASTDNPDLTTLLLDFGANVHYTDNRGRRPIDIAVGGSVVAGILRSHAGWSKTLVCFIGRRKR